MVYEDVSEININNIIVERNLYLEELRCSDTIIKRLKEKNNKLNETIDKAIKHIKTIAFQISINGSYRYIKLDDLEQGKELLSILGDDNV